MPRLSDKTRLKEKRCQKEGLDYIPWIKVREVSSNGTSSIVTNWKTGRRVHLLSIAEKDVFYTLNFREDVIDVREQYALLNKELVNKIADAKGFNKPRGFLSTDLLLTTTSGLHAISVKASRDQIKNKTRDLEKLTIEKTYWNLQNVPYSLVFGEDINKIKVRNIKLCAEIFDTSFIEDDVMALKFLIIHRIINPDMDKAYLNFKDLLITYRKEIDLLYDNTSKRDRPYWQRGTHPQGDIRKWDTLYKI